MSLPETFSFLYCDFIFLLGLCYTSFKIKGYTMKLVKIIITLLLTLQFANADLTTEICTNKIDKLDKLFQRATKLNKTDRLSTEQLKISDKGISLCSKGCGDGCYFFMQDRKKGTEEGCNAKYYSEGACLDILMESMDRSNQSSFDKLIAKKLCAGGSKLACSMLHPEDFKKIFGKNIIPVQN